MTTQQQYADYMFSFITKSVEPVVVESGRGRTLRATDGREYLDCYSGISVVNAGHNHPKIIAAAVEQMQKLVHCCSYVYQVPAVAALAEKLAQITPGHLRRTFFGNSGAEANEGALRLAKQATGKREIVALGYSFHGRTLATLSITGNVARKKNNGPYVSGTAFGPAPYCYRCPLKLEYPSCGLACAHGLRDTLRQQTSGDVAAFVAEPLLGEGGILTPPQGYFEVAVKLFHEAGALFIADEVQSGFGRTGRMFGIEHHDQAQPDIVTMAKGIAAGFPLGAFSAREELGNVLQPGDHLSTFGGNPVSCAAALANIQVLQEERLAENAAACGAELLSRFRQLQEKCGLIGDVRGQGLMLGLEFVRDRKTKEPADRETKEIRAAMREQGVLVGSGGIFGNVLRFQPPLSITREECDKAASVLETVLARLGHANK